MMFTLRQLEIFLAVAKHENISKAANELCMSQSAASTALLQLENQFDVQLFDRSGKSLSLSQTGASVRANAHSLMESCKDFEHQLLGKSENSYLNVGASMTIGSYLGVKYYSDYLAQYPDTQLEFQIANSPDIISKVINLELDAGLIEAEVNHSDLKLVHWRQDQLVAFCSPDHPLANKRVLTKSDIIDSRWVLREAGSGSRQTFDREMQSDLPNLNIFLELEHNEAIKRAVEANVGLGCLSEIAVAANIERGDLVPLQLPGVDFSRNFYFALNKNKPVSKAVERWILLCRDNLA